MRGLLTLAPLSLAVLVCLPQKATEAVAAQKDEEKSPLEGDPARGRRFFVRKKCVDCHAILGSGGKLGPDLAAVGKGRDFHTLVARLWDHSPRMIESMAERRVGWPSLRANQMADLIAYLYYLNYFDKPGDYQRGKEAFRKKGCFRCHEVGGIGGDVAPPLDEYASAASPLKMVTAMWNHGPAMVQQFKLLRLEPPRFEGSEAADLLAYLHASTVTASVGREYLSPGDPKRGRRVFETKQCSTCHPVRGVGGGTDLDLVKANLKRSVSEIAGILWNHGPLIWEKLGHMKVAVQPFTVEQMTDLVSYLYFIGYYDSRGDAKKGEQLFRDRGCAECHGESAKSEFKGPVLSRMTSCKDPVSLAAAFWNHAPNMLEAIGEEMMAWPSFTGQEMRDLAQYLRSGGDPDAKERSGGDKKDGDAEPGGSGK